MLGRSNIVGMPVAHLLQSMDATVTVCHSRTPDIPAHVRRADIVIAAVGRAEMVKARAIAHPARCRLGHLRRESQRPACTGNATAGGLAETGRCRHRCRRQLEARRFHGQGLQIVRRRGLRGGIAGARGDGLSASTAVGASYVRAPNLLDRWRAPSRQCQVASGP